MSNAETFRKWLSNEVEAARCKNKSVDELEETSDELEEFQWIWEVFTPPLFFFCLLYFDLEILICQEVFSS